MPAVYAHLRFGEEVVKALPPLFSNLVEKYPEAFALGTQGPDILFYHHPMKSNEIKTQGSYLHTLSGTEFFHSQAERLLQIGSKLEEIIEREGGAHASYLCGFLCHFTLDVLCHPYIERQTREALSHGKIESELDKALLRLDEKPIRGYNTATPILDQNGVKEAVSKTLDVPKENIAVAIKTIRKINKLFSFPCEAFHVLAHVVLKIAKMERKFGDMFLHKKDDPLCKEATQVLIELWKEAIPKAVELIQEFFENLENFVKTGEIKNELFRCNFSGIIKTEDK